MVTPSITLPAERAEANKRSCLIGKARSFRISRMVEPTTPVAPTMPTFNC